LTWAFMLSRAFPMRPTGVLRVACREEGQVVELDAAQAVRLVVLHEEQARAGHGATGARPLVESDDEVRRLVRCSAKPLRLAGREV
jgi:hypothetical protein